MSEWISVEDDLPNECVPVIAIDSGQHALIICTIYDNKFVQDTSVAEAYNASPLEPLKDFNVTHWRSLPGTPK